MNKKYEFRAFTISKIEDGILLVEIKKIKEMVIQDVIDLHTSVGEMCDGKKTAVLSTFEAYIPMNDDVMALSMKKDYQDKIFAAATVVRSTALRVAIKFFSTFHKPKQPRKIFDSKDKALQWLRKIKSEVAEKESVLA